jgi:hypothetical protein
MGEESERITLPIDIKKLEERLGAITRGFSLTRQGPAIPECRAGAQHVLPQCPHDAVRAGAVSENVDGS